VTQIAALFHGHITWPTVLSAGLIFWLVWWAWTQFTWALNAANTDHSHIRLGTLAATAVAFFMAVEVPNAFTHGALWFAGPYVAVRLIGLLLYKWVTASDPDMHAAVRRFFLFSLTGLVAVWAGAFLGGTAQYWLWGSAILLDVVAAQAGVRMEGWDLQVGHFVERHGLIVIIALGECLIVAAAGLTDAPRSFGTVALGFFAVAISCGFWWSYFPYANPALEKAMNGAQGTPRAGLARDAFSLGHFPMLCGIVAFAVGVEAAVAHPELALPIDARIGLGIGFLLFVGGTGVALWRAAGILLKVRFALALGTAVAVSLVEGPPHFSLGIMLAAIAILVMVEHPSMETD
jgi:low temperature requirement protein LtrA